MKHVVLFFIFLFFIYIYIYIFGYFIRKHVRGFDWWNDFFFLYKPCMLVSILRENIIHIDTWEGNIAFCLELENACTRKKSSSASSA